MREFRFTVEYDEGSDPLMDLFILNEGLYNRSKSISVSTSGLWRVDSFTGPEEVLEELEMIYKSNLVCNDCLGVHKECDAVWQYQIIREEKGLRTIYSYLRQISYCHSIPFLSIKHMGNGLFFYAERYKDKYNWRVLMPEDNKAGELYDALEENLPNGISINLKQLKKPNSWLDSYAGTTELPHEQRNVLVTSIEMGYYDTPRGATLQELAEKLGIPESTCRYRLRRAEDWLTKSFIQQNKILTSEKQEQKQ